MKNCLSSCLFLVAMSTQLFSGEVNFSKSVEELEVQAATLLSSKKEDEQAWGAWFVAHYRLRRLMAVTQKTLVERLKEQNPPARWVMSCVDALIQNDCLECTEIEIALQKHDFNSEALMLAAFSKSAPPEMLIQIIERVSDHRLAAAMNVFVRDHPMRFAEWALKTFKRSYQLSVTTGESGVFRRLVVKRNNVDHLRVPEKGDWPPTVEYEFVCSPSTGDVLLASGTQLVFIRRHFTYPGETAQLKARPEEFNVCADEYAFACLVNSCGASKAELPSGFRVNANIEYKSDAQYLAELQKGYDDCCLKWNTLLNRLGMKGSPKLSLPPISVESVDFRTDQSRPLPEFQPKE